MLSNHSNEVLSYWYSLRRANKAPLRTQFDPTEIRSRLPDLIMLGWQDLDLVFRLAGTRVCELFGEELRDRTFETLWNPRSRDQVAEATLSAFRSETAIHCSVNAIQNGRAVRLEMLLLPLRSADGACDRLLGSIVLGEDAPPSYIINPGTLVLDTWQPTFAPGTVFGSTTEITRDRVGQSFIRRLFHLS
ncbi:PAS domain-containing protein [Rhizobium lemnae]|uniref:PAS domain-containing protein n=1 Tax=Rhizobium lemnae TaxID=1214924 RepID=A0ABV8E9S3_9HYPH|nr:PAS domain-containing protein [Rhizobium lemnae]MCJ8506939.1 PAS domain-containing protein [Rhizobium lemnae]